jgi:hypothetical protein
MPTHGSWKPRLPATTPKSWKHEHRDHPNPHLHL